MAFEARSADRLIKLDVMPPRSFGYTSDPLMLQTLEAGAKMGGCAVNPPFDAARYANGFAKRDLGAVASNVQGNAAREARLKVLDDQANAIAAQYGTNSRQTTTLATADLAWLDGSDGVLEVGVSTTTTTRQRPPRRARRGGRLHDRGAITCRRCGSWRRAP